MKPVYILVIVLVAVVAFFAFELAGGSNFVAENIFPNNNPCNLRPSAGETWLGQTGISPNDFVIFDTIEDGLRAAGMTAISYQLVDGIKNLSDFGDRWAPPASIGGDNEGAAVGGYGANLAATLGADPAATFDLTTGSPFALGQLLHAIVVNENGSIKAALVPQSTYDQYAQVAMAARGIATA